VASTTYWYQSTAQECPTPLYYRLGELDASFDLSPEAAKQYVAEAEAYWENITRRDLFVYDDTADFTVNFIFDDRQEFANEEENLQAKLDDQRTESEQIKEVIEGLQEDYDELAAAYETRVSNYESRLSAYNAEVNKYNDRGGAPAEVFSQLEDERTELNQIAESLSNTATELNDFAARINELGERGNRIVEDFNHNVDLYNDRFVTEEEFTQGDYTGSAINIYKFSNDNELMTVLGHELGHALGIGHVDEPGSVMYYLLGDTSRRTPLSESDIEAYYSVCGQTESLEQRARAYIRSLLKLF